MEILGVFCGIGNAVRQNIVIERAPVLTDVIHLISDLQKCAPPPPKEIISPAATAASTRKIKMEPET